MRNVLRNPRAQWSNSLGGSPTLIDLIHPPRTPGTRPPRRSASLNDSCVSLRLNQLAGSAPNRPSFLTVKEPPFSTILNFPYYNGTRKSRLLKVATLIICARGKARRAASRKTSSGMQSLSETESTYCPIARPASVPDSVSARACAPGEFFEGGKFATSMNPMNISSKD